MIRFVTMRDVMEILKLNNDDQMTNQSDCL